MILVFYGLPGTGKGTQAKLVANDLSYLHISTGDLLRDVIKNKKEGYEELEKFINAGKLVPDDVILKMLKLHIESNRDANGFILDGFPRNVAQYELLQELIENDLKDSIKNIFIDTKPEEVLRRITGRRVCSNCGKIYNIHQDGEVKACTVCNHEVIQRKDDSKEVFEKRLETYGKLTQPLIDFLKKEGKLFSVDGNTSEIEKIKADIMELIKNL